jgi:hypothetical protein
MTQPYFRLAGNDELDCRIKDLRRGRISTASVTDPPRDDIRVASRLFRMSETTLYPRIRELPQATTIRVLLLR